LLLNHAPATSHQNQWVKTNLKPSECDQYSATKQAEKINGVKWECNIKNTFLPIKYKNIIMYCCSTMLLLLPATQNQ
jgi:hypothetical protein